MHGNELYNRDQMQSSLAVPPLSLLEQCGEEARPGRGIINRAVLQPLNKTQESMTSSFCVPAETLLDCSLQTQVVPDRGFICSLVAAGQAEGRLLIGQKSSWLHF